MIFNVLTKPQINLTGPYGDLKCFRDEKNKREGFAVWQDSTCALRVAKISNIKNVSIATIEPAIDGPLGDIRVPVVALLHNEEIRDWPIHETHYHLYQAYFEAVGWKFLCDEFPNQYKKAKKFYIETLCDELMIEDKKVITQLFKDDVLLTPDEVSDKTYALNDNTVV